MTTSDYPPQERALRWLILHCGPEFEFGTGLQTGIYVKSPNFDVVITPYGDIVGTIHLEVFDAYFAKREAGLPTEAVETIQIDTTTAEPTT